MDGSFHAWFETAEQPCLIDMVDDATGRMTGRFFEQETTEGAMVRELREEAGVEAIGRPRLLSVHSSERLFRGDHVLVYRVDQWRKVASSSHGEILHAEFFAPDALPDAATFRSASVYYRVEEAEAFA